MLSNLLSNPDVQTLLFSAAAAIIGWFAARRSPSPAPAPAPAPSPAPQVPTPKNPLDINSDGAVDLKDLLAVLQNLLAARKQAQARAVLADLAKEAAESPAK